MAELADAPDLGSGGRPCRFKSCYPHFETTILEKSKDVVLLVYEKKLQLKKAERDFAIV